MLSPLLTEIILFIKNIAVVTKLAQKISVYINIERHFFEKAQKLCCLMLNENENKDFALNELRHIQRLREKGVQELTPTLNPPIEIAPEKIISERIFDHPIFDANALNAQKRVGEIQGVRNFWYCGAWQGYGFHEDGLQSGLAVAEAISGRKRPWDFDNSQNRLAYQMPQMVQNA